MACPCFRPPKVGVSTLSRIAPDHLAEAKQREDCAIENPVLVADHERLVVRSGQTKPLQSPKASADHHQQTDQAADDPHDDVECPPHIVPRVESRTLRPHPSTSSG